MGQTQDACAYDRDVHTGFRHLTMILPAAFPQGRIDEAIFQFYEGHVNGPPGGMVGENAPIIPLP